MNRSRNSLRYSGVLGLLLFAGCATVEEPLRGNLLDESPAVRACAEKFNSLDSAVERAGVRDAEAYRIPGFPYLRVDRFSAHLHNGIRFDKDPPAFAQWVSRLLALDRDARRAEISNLPEAEVRALDSGGRVSLTDNAEQCAALLRARDLASPERAALLGARAQVPDAYVGMQRIAGLYALTRIPFSWGIAQWQSEVLRDFRSSAAGGRPGQPLQRYALANPPLVTRERIAAIISGASENRLQIPQYSDAERALLVRAFAPVFEIETGGADDHIGRLAWNTDVVPEVDTTMPVVYHRIAFTRYGNRNLTQLVYTIWFPRRPHDHALDLLAGRLDGLVFRVTLSTDGDPLVYDSIHPCGCFHLFFPTARVRTLPAPAGAGEWVFVPSTLPAHAVGARITVRVATRTHYLIQVSLDKTGEAQVYTLAPEDELRALPAAEHQRRVSPPQRTRSAYGPDGLVPGSERGERLLFWPMGIPSAGAMRQWGHHATAFVGRRHFDDGDLIEKRFQIILP